MITSDTVPTVSDEPTQALLIYWIDVYGRIEQLGVLRHIYISGFYLVVIGKNANNGTCITKLRILELYILHYGIFDQQIPGNFGCVNTTLELSKGWSPQTILNSPNH